MANVMTSDGGGGSSVQSKVYWIRREIENLKEYSAKLTSGVFSDDKYSVGVIKSALDKKIEALETKIDNIEKAADKMDKWGGF